LQLLNSSTFKEQGVPCNHAILVNLDLILL